MLDFSRVQNYYIACGYTDISSILNMYGFPPMSTGMIITLRNMPVMLAKRAPAYVNPVNTLARKPARPARTSPRQSS